MAITSTPVISIFLLVSKFLNNGVFFFLLAIVKGYHPLFQPGDYIYDINLAAII